MQIDESRSMRAYDVHVCESSRDIPNLAIQNVLNIVMKGEARVGAWRPARDEMGGQRGRGNRWQQSGAVGSLGGDAGAGVAVTDQLVDEVVTKLVCDEVGPSPQDR